MKKIMILGSHGFGNRGDDAILVSMVNNLKHICPELDTVAISKKPKETKLLGIRTVSRINIFRIIFEMLGCNLLVCGGGSLLQDVTSTRSIIYYFSIITLAKLLNKKIMLYANGIGPIRKKYNRILTKLIVSKVNLITLRDEDSKEELSRLGVIGPEIIVTADPVFTLEIKDKINTSSIFEKLNMPKDKKCIGISIRKWKTTSDYQGVIADIADTIIEKYNYNVLFIPMQMPNDLSIISSVQKRMVNKSYTISDKINVQEYIDIIGGLHMLISMRLHTLIIAAVKTIPMIGLIYDPKVKSFLDMIEQPSAGDISDLDKDKFIELFEEVLNNRDEATIKLEKYIKDLKEKAKTNDEKVIELLK